MSGVTITAEMRAKAMAEALRELGRHSRVPFRKVLAELLGAAPTGPALIAFANAHPDKWAQAVGVFAGMSGYEKGLVELNIYNVAQLSDVELLREFHKGEGQLEKLGIRRAPVVIEQGPQAQAADTDLPNPVGVAGDSAQENRRDEPAPSAPPRVERDAAGDLLDPAGAV